MFPHMNSVQKPRTPARKPPAVDPIPATNPLVLLSHRETRKPGHPNLTNAPHPAGGAKREREVDELKAPVGRFAGACGPALQLQDAFALAPPKRSPRLRGEQRYCELHHASTFAPAWRPGHCVSGRRAAAHLSPPRRA